MSDLVNQLLGSTPPANPLWWNNQVGTETLAPGSSLTNPSGNGIIDPVVGGTRDQPLMGSQVTSARDALRQAVQTSVAMALGFTGSIRGYHGTGATFAPEPGAPLGKFRDEFIGSGEGAQAYGHGHYVAGNQRVGANYMGAGEPYALTLDGKPMRLDDLGTLNEPGAQVAAEHLFNNGFDPQAAAKSIQEAKPSSMLETYGNWSGLKQYLADMGLENEPADVAEHRKTLAEQDQAIEAEHKAALDWIPSNMHRVGPPPGGNLYHVEITPDEHELLDWDRPLSEQSPQVQERLKGPLTEYRNKMLEDSKKWWAPGKDESEAYAKHADEFLASMPGSEIYHAIVESTRVGEPEKTASAMLHQAGVPGIRYLDAGSRRPGVADPTRNYVIFHPSNLRIVGRNGEMLQPEPVDHDPFGEVSANDQ